MRIACVVFYTNDLPRAVQFYREMLGSEFVRSDGRFAEFQFGGTMLGIKVQEEPREAPGHQTVILECSDVNSVYEECLQHGIQPAKELSVESWGKNFAILDPDGNKVEFVEGAG